MKRLIVCVLALLVLLMSLASFASCAGQVEQGRYSFAECNAEWVDEISGSQKKKLAEVEGYENKQDYIDDKIQKVRAAFSGSSFVFHSDGTGEFTIANQKEAFAWEQDGKRVEIDFKGSEAAMIFSDTDFEMSFGNLVARVHDIEYQTALTVVLTYELK